MENLNSEDMLLYEKLSQKMKYLNGISSSKDENNLKFHIVDYFVSQNNERMSISDLSLNFSSVDREEIKKAVGKLDEWGTLVDLGSKNRTYKRYKSISEAMESADYQLEEKVFQLHKEFVNIASSVEEVKSTLRGKDLKRFSELFEQFVSLLDQISNKESVDYNKLLINDGDSSLIEELFSNPNGLYYIIEKNLNNLEKVVRDLETKIVTINSTEEIFPLLSEFQRILDNLIAFAKDILNDKIIYIDQINDQFNELASIHDSSDLYQLYGEIVKNSSERWIKQGLKKDSLELLVTQMDNIVKKEKNVRHCVFNQLLIRIKKLLETLTGIGSYLSATKRVVDNQVYFRNIAIEFEEDDIEEINLEVDKYFQTSSIEHYVISINDENIEIKDDTLHYALDHKNNKKNKSRKKKSVSHSVNERYILNRERKKNKELLDKRMSMVKNLFPDNEFTNKLLTDDEFNFMSKLFLSNVDKFKIQKNGWYKATCTDKDLLELMFEFSFKNDKSKDKIYLKSKNALLEFGFSDINVKVVGL